MSGKQLLKIVDGAKTIEYKYNADGLMSEKSVKATSTSAAVVTKYVWEGTKMVAELPGANNTATAQYFYYDTSGQITAMERGSFRCSFIKNAQGDVIATQGSAVSNSLASGLNARYAYDAWGNHIYVQYGSGTTASSTAHASVNPFRYRGYFFDKDSGMYYLKSRWYVPELRRFLNADIFVSTNAIGLLSANMYTYCENDPVNMVDPGGACPWHQNGDYDSEVKRKEVGCEEGYTDKKIKIYPANLYRGGKIPTGNGIAWVFYDESNTYIKSFYYEYGTPSFDKTTDMVLIFGEAGVISARKSWKYGGIGVDVLKGYAGVQTMNDGTGAGFDILSVSGHLNISREGGKVYSLDFTIGVGYAIELGVGAKGGWGPMFGLQINSY